MTVVFCSVFLIVGTGTMKLMSRGNELHTRDVKVVKSFWANEAAMRVATRYLTRANPHPQEDIANLNVGPDPIDINGFQPTVFIDNQGSNRYQITANTMVDNLKNETTVSQVSFNSYVRYTWFEERSNVPWAAFTVNGNYHINKRLLIHRNMTNEVHVNGEATCASKYFNSYPDVEEYGIGLMLTSGNRTYGWFNDRIPKYKGGVDSISTALLAPAAGEFDDGWNIEVETSTNYPQYLVEMQPINSDGKLNIYGLQSGNNWIPIPAATNISVDNIYNNNSGIIISDKPVHVAGTLQGQLTIVSQKDIILAGNILYSDVVPGEAPTEQSQDVLGLVAGNIIMLPDNFDLYNDPDLNFTPLNWSSDNSIEVYCAMFSKDLKPQSFSASKWHSTKDFNLRGSILLDQMGGTFGGNSGFVVHATGDTRYMQNLLSPPGIPEPRAADREMRDHWKVPMAMSYPFSVPLTWDNYMVKL